MASRLEDHADPVVIYFAAAVLEKIDLRSNADDEIEAAQAETDEVKSELDQWKEWYKGAP